MDHLIKQNIENIGGSAVKRRKDNAAFEGIKKLKTLIKPLSDVKNIIEDKVNVEQVQKDVLVKSKLAPVITEDNCDELFFCSQSEDFYEDIIPKSLQLEENDISKLATMFDNISVKKYQEDLNRLPELGFEMTFYDYVNEDLCECLKGIDSTSLLFDDMI